jgi:very-short-patch-repair endonuclease
MESRARLAFADGGLPEPELNADIVDDAGNWIARGDFVWREARVVVEYEGDVHRTDRQQWLTDVARTELLEDAGWRVIRITARDLSTPHLRARMVARIRRALMAGAR